MLPFLWQLVMEMRQNEYFFLLLFCLCVGAGVFGVVYDGFLSNAEDDPEGATPVIIKTVKGKGGGGGKCHLHSASVLGLFLVGDVVGGKWLEKKQGGWKGDG